MIVVVRDHLADEQQRREDHPDLHRHREVGEDGQREGDEPDGDVGATQLEQLGDLPPLAHVPGDHHQDRREHGQRDVAGERRGEEQDGGSVRREPSRPPASSPPTGCSSRCARWRRSPAARRTAARRCWRRPGRSARRSGCAGRRSSGRRRPRTSATRWPPASRPSAPARAAAGSGRAGMPARARWAARPGCRRTGCRWCRPGGPPAAATTVPPSSATSVGGTRGANRHDDESCVSSDADAERRRRRREAMSACAARTCDPAEEVARNVLAPRGRRSP